MHVCLNHLIVAVMTVAASAWALPAAALDRVRAIDVAKNEVKEKCDPATSCTFTAKVEEGKWHVRVDFPKRASAAGKPGARAGGHAIFIINQTGKVVGRVERK